MQGRALHAVACPARCVMASYCQPWRRPMPRRQVITKTHWSRYQQEGHAGRDHPAQECAADRPEHVAGAVAAGQGVDAQRRGGGGRSGIQRGAATGRESGGGGGHAGPGLRRPKANSSWCWSRKVFASRGLPPRHSARIAAAAGLRISAIWANPPTRSKAIDEARAIDSRNADVWLAEVPIRIRARQFKEANRGRRQRRWH